MHLAGQFLFFRGHVINGAACGTAGIIRSILQVRLQIVCGIFVLGHHGSPSAWVDLSTGTRAQPVARFSAA